MKITKIALLVAATLAVSPAMAATNLLTNGSFENGLTGWSETASNNNATVQVTNYSNNNITPDNITTNPSPDAVGNNGVYFFTDTGNDTLSQTVSLIAGHTYNLGYDYYTSGYGNQYGFTMALQIAGTTVGSTSSSVSQGTWYTANYSYTATSTGTATFALAFSGLGTPAKDELVDRVYLLDSSSAAPEPASWMMMIGGFGMVGAALRRARQTGLRLA